MNDMSDNLEISKIQDISGVAEEFYRTIADDNEHG